VTSLIAIGLFTITAYCLPGHTASGTAVHSGTIAADWHVLPPGTQLVVPGYGEGTVEDTGSAITGRTLDLWMGSCTLARLWGRQQLPVYRLADAPQSGPSPDRVEEIAVYSERGNTVQVTRYRRGDGTAYDTFRLIDAEEAHAAADP
jgi:3D (Asp-Asp-Asp) domain-containing protein